jgi:hypothetical protein
MIEKPPKIVPEIERMVVARIEKLEAAALDPSTASESASRLEI